MSVTPLKAVNGIVPSLLRRYPTMKDTTPAASIKDAIILTINSIASVLKIIIIAPSAMKSTALNGAENLFLYPNLIILSFLLSANLRDIHIKSKKNPVDFDSTGFHNLSYIRTAGRHLPEATYRPQKASEYLQAAPAPPGVPLPPAQCAMHAHQYTSVRYIHDCSD